MMEPGKPAALYQCMHPETRTAALSWGLEVKIQAQPQSVAFLGSSYLPSLHTQDTVRSYRRVVACVIRRLMIPPTG